MVVSLQNFFPIFSKTVAFFGKIVKWKTIQNLISHKKGYIHFCRQTSPSFKRDLGPETMVLPFFQKIQPFLKKLLKNKVFSTSFVIKKVTLTFCARRLLSLKNCQRCLQNSFYSFLRKWWIFKKSIKISEW